MNRQELEDAILTILKASPHHLEAKEILRDLRRSFAAGSLTKNDVNSVLYGELSRAGKVVKDGESRWSVTASMRAPSTVSTSAERPSTASASAPQRAANPAVLATRPSPTSSGVGKTSPVFTADDLASVSAAVREEIAAAQQQIKSSWLDIDGIEHLSDQPGAFGYRLVLSTPCHFSPDMPLTFQTRNPRDTIQAVVIRSDDEGLIIECQKPLPTDAKLLNFSLDPTFILRALEQFVLEMASCGGRIAQLVLSKSIPTPKASQARPFSGLNEDQAQAVEEMASTPLHLLWGPPGTGKTTLGVAIVRWLRQRKRVLVVSTSNAAVDVAIRAVLKNVRPEEKRLLLRLGTSLDPQVREITVAGKLALQNSALAQGARKAQEWLRQIRELLQNRSLSSDRLHDLFAEAGPLEKRVSEFTTLAVAATPQLMASAQVMGCTLARMVLDARLREQAFDVVVLDEASMASLLYAVAAAFLASDHLVYAGDPKQLPPIVQAEGRNAARWFGQNVYDWFGVEMGGEVRATGLSLLRTQYRMTDQIGGVVSRLSYSGLLRRGRRTSGPSIEFIDIDGEWATHHYSVSEKSYFHLAAVPLLHSLARLLGHDELLFLSPFRPQRSLLAALTFDLRSPDRERKMTASTIHRAQGSEAKAVVVDLTTHSPQHLVAFFRDKHCERLFNVAISRAKDQLIILSSRAMLRGLAKEMPFWSRVESEFGSGLDVLSCGDLVEDLDQIDDLGSLTLDGAKHLPAIYSHSQILGPSRHGSKALRKVTASRKLLILPEEAEVEAGDCIVRTSANCPPVFVGGGYVCVPYQGKWLVVNSPNVSRVLWRIGFSHLADDEVDPGQARRFFCPDCSNGDLVLKQFRGEGWFLVCTNGRGHECHYRRRLSLEDAKVKVRLQGMKCSRGHPLTARQGGTRMFLGCENYPACDFTESLSILEGM